VNRDSTWCRYDAASRRIALAIRVQPNARRNEIVGLHGDALKIKIAAPAVDNKANAALVEFLSEALGVPKALISLRRGATGRRKVVEISGDPALAARIKALAASRLTNHDSRITPSTSK